MTDFLEVQVTFVNKLGQQLRKRKQRWNVAQANKALSTAISKLDSSFQQQLQNKYEEHLQQLCGLLEIEELPTAKKQKVHKQVPQEIVKGHRDKQQVNYIESRTWEQTMDECINKGILINSSSVLYPALQFLYSDMQSPSCSFEQIQSRLLWVSQYIEMVKFSDINNTVCQFMLKGDENSQERNSLLLYYLLQVITLIKTEQFDVSSIKENTIKFFVNKVSFSTEIKWEVICEGITGETQEYINDLVQQGVLTEVQGTLVNIILFELGLLNSQNDTKDEQQYFDIILTGLCVVNNRKQIGLSASSQIYQLATQLVIPYNIEKWVSQSQRTSQITQKRGKDLSLYLLQNMLVEEVKNLQQEFMKQNIVVGLQQNSQNKVLNNHEDELFFIDTEINEQQNNLFKSVMDNQGSEDEEGDEGEEGEGIYEVGDA
eukprot:TRINITY_DN7470_c0_g2_i1.p1 TRINITY_DN7470_c0_g2~~TRINITY_DN7470_c0_g2_i1.p1  ORF type:complete len:456 (+),score=41.38 TRINITY_DN7470_c0_g2_i1:80-1369(+)